MTTENTVSRVSINTDGSVEVVSIRDLDSVQVALQDTQTMEVLRPLLERLATGAATPLVVPNVAPNLVILRDQSCLEYPVQGHLRIRELIFSNPVALRTLDGGRLVWTPALDRTLRGAVATQPLVWRVPNTWRLFWSIAFDPEGTVPGVFPFPRQWRMRQAWMTLLSTRGKTIYRPCLPNIHNDGRICFGPSADKIYNYRADNAVAAIEFAWNTFCASPWNTDLFDGEATTMEALVAFDGDTMKQIDIPGTPDDGHPHSRQAIGLTVARGLLTAFQHIK